MNHNLNYPPESAGGLMETQVPIANSKEKVLEIIQNLSKKDWGDIHAVFVMDEEGKLEGFIPIAKILSAKDKDIALGLVEKSKLTISPFADQEEVVIEAIKADVESVPVVDEMGKFLGVIFSDKIIDVLHMEHLEDFLRSSGIRGKGSHIIELATSNLTHIVRARIPWLVIGLSVGLGLSVIASKFEVSLQQNIALAFFIPVIAYIADSVGTQTETIFIRALTVLKLNLFNYIFKEFLVGTIIGSILGMMAGIGASFIAQNPLVGLVVGLSLFIAISVATVLACIVPIAFKALGKDPALGSGPLATAMQDLISLTIYFVIASVILQ